LIQEGDCSKDLQLLAEGWAYRHLLTREGARQITAILLPGDFVNLDGLLLDRSDYAVRTLTPVSVVSLSRASAMAVAERHVQSMHLYLRRIAVENAMLGRWALCLGRMSGRTRLAHFLCELAVRLAGIRESHTFECPLTQEQIADVLGLTSVHVNRTFKNLRSDGLVELCGKTITIPSFADLARIGEFDPVYLHHSELARSGDILPGAGDCSSTELVGGER
jgi:CRP-like cAMP-binding protein